MVDDRVRIKTLPTITALSQNGSMFYYEIFYDYSFNCTYQYCIFYNFINNENET